MKAIFVLQAVSKWTFTVTVLCHPPLALSSFELEFNIVDSVRRSAFASLLLRSNQLLPEDIVICLFSNLVYDDLFLIIRYLVDDVLRSAAAELELVERRDAFWIDRKPEIVAEPSASLLNQVMQWMFE